MCRGRKAGANTACSGHRKEASRAASQTPKGATDPQNLHDFDLLQFDEATTMMKKVKKELLKKELLKKELLKKELLNKIFYKIYLRSILFIWDAFFIFTKV